MEHSLFNVENYNKKIKESCDEIVARYLCIINEYLLHACENIVITDYEYFLFIVNRGLSCLNHIFNHLVLYTKNLELTQYHCRKAYMYYVEFIGQIGDINHSYLQLNSKDAMLFIYKKTIFELNNEYRKNFILDDGEEILFKFISESTKLYDDILEYVIENDNLKNKDTRVSYIMYAEKMSEKIIIKYLSINESMERKIDICSIFNYYKNILKSKNIKDECKFLNLVNLFFKKLLNQKNITKDKIKNKLFTSNGDNKLKNLTPLKFTNWLFNIK